MTSRVSSNVGPSGWRACRRRPAAVRSPSVEHPVDAQLGAGQVLLDQQGLGGGPFGWTRTRRIRTAASTAAAGVVGAQHALAGAERHRLDHAREPDRLGRLPDGSRRGVAGTIANRGWGTPAAAQRWRCRPPCRWRRAPRRPGCAAGRGAAATVGGQHEHRGISGDDRVDRVRLGPAIRRALASSRRTGRDDRAAPTGSAPSLATVRSRPILVGGEHKVGRAVAAGGDQQQHAACRRHRFSGEKNGPCPPRGR